MKTLKEKHKQYTTDFKLTAVRLAEHPNIQTQDVAIARYSSFYVVQMEKGKFKGGAMENLKDMEEQVLEQKQVRELEKRIKRLELENALLKKSMPHGSKQN